MTLFSLCGSILSAVASAESLDDFKNVDGLTGCASIPYAEERRRCTDTMVEVHDRCKLEAWSTGIADPKVFLAAADSLEKAVKALQSEKSTLESKRSAANDAEKSNLEQPLSTVERSITELSQRQTEQKELAGGARRELELRRAIGEKCLEVRTQVQKYFETAISRARGESDPLLENAYKVPYTT